MSSHAPRPASRTPKNFSTVVAQTSGTSNLPSKIPSVSLLAFVRRTTASVLRMLLFAETTNVSQLRTTTFARRLTSRKAATLTFQFRSVTQSFVLRRRRTCSSAADVMLIAFA